MLVAAAPVLALQAAVDAGYDTPGWTHQANGFRLAQDARARITGDPANPDAGLTIGPGALPLARAAYAREPLASDAVFVLALAQTPLGEGYRAPEAVRLGARVDQRNAVLQLLLIADAATDGDLERLLARADVLAAAHPDLAKAMLVPVFDQLADPSTLPIVAAALAREPRWSGAFKSYVPTDDEALGNYLALRRAVGGRAPWPGDDKLVGALVGHRRYGEAFDLWRSLAGRAPDPYGFARDGRLAPIGWLPVAQGDRIARIGDDGTMQVSLERGAGGELARQLLDLAPGRYRLDVKIDGGSGSGPLTAELRCAAGNRGTGPRQELGQGTEFATVEAGCPAYWLIIEGSALESRDRFDATLSGWRFTRVG